MFSNKLLILFLGLLSISFVCDSALVPANNNFIQRKLNLYNDIKDADKFQVEYEVDLESKIITFDVTVETTGFVGFGFSPGKGMSGADIIIGGVLSDKSTYFSDRYATGNSEPQIDDEQNWELLIATENATHTYLQFSRLLNTCDKNHDVPITDDTLSIIWSYGETDTVQKHIDQGSYAINLLDPAQESDVSKFQKWNIVRNMTMPPRKTSYWCTIHKAPQFTEKRHIVGFNTKLESPEALKHTHHLIVYQCLAPGENLDEIFGPLLTHPGVESSEAFEVLRADLCITLLHTWAVGGKPMMFPANVGYSLVEGNEPVYVMYEIHYDNPDALTNVTFESTVEIYHTNITREHEAAMLVVDHVVSYSHLIPGNTAEFVSVGHCGSECTKRRVNKEGFKIFNVLHHAHLAGRKLKLRQFRDGTELSWVSYDENYAFDYQQNRPLREEKLVLPGDHLTVECTYSTTGKRDVTLGGLSTNEEMCQAIMWYYPKDELRFCESAYPEWEFQKQFGIEGINWDNVMEPPIILGPAPIANKSLGDYLTNDFSWTADKVKELQQIVRYEPHYQVTCANNPIHDPFRRKWTDKTWSNKKMQEGEIEYLTYPEFDKEYSPKDVCEERAGGSSTTESEGAGGSSTKESGGAGGGGANILSLSVFGFIVCVFVQFLKG